MTLRRCCSRCPDTGCWTCRWSRTAAGGVLVETYAAEAACPRCGVFTVGVHERPVRRVKDLPHGTVPLRVRCTKDLGQGLLC